MLLERQRAHIQSQSTQGFIWLDSCLWIAASEMEDSGKVLKIVAFDQDFSARTLHENWGQGSHSGETELSMTVCKNCW